VCQGRQLTYGALNEQANRFAHYLLAHHNLRPDELVGVLLARSEWMIVAILGILKAGAAYVPIDPDYPQERIDYIVQDSHCKLLVDHAALASFQAQAGLYPSTNPEVPGTTHDLAYVIYTSGTTGNPKGVLIERRSIKGGQQLLRFGFAQIQQVLHRGSRCLHDGAQQLGKVAGQALGGSLEEEVAVVLQP
jgi:non-ribosomal peptide synthetase component F